jgi:hypothetical protein
VDGRVDERKVAVNEGFEYQGFWWLPGSEKDKVPGTLRFDPDEGAILDLLGSPKGLEGVIEPIEPEIILGLSSDGEYITLKDCGRTKGSVRFGPGFATSTFAANTVFVGAQFGRAEDVGFERLIVEYLHLGEWTGASGFEIKAPKDLEVDPLVVEYRLPEPVTARVGDQYEVSLRFWASLDGPPGRRTEATVTQTAGLVVKSPEKRPLEDIMEIAYRLQHFLSLGVRRSVYPVSVWGAMGTPGEVVPVEIHYRPLGMTGDTGRPRQRNMLFSLRDLPEGFGPAVARWLERAEILDPVYRLYLGTVYNPESFLEQQFLNLVQALEVYHRRAMHNHRPAGGRARETQGGDPQGRARRAQGLARRQARIQQRAESRPTAQGHHPQVPGGHLPRGGGEQQGQGQVHPQGYGDEKLPHPLRPEVGGRCRALGGALPCLEEAEIPDRSVLDGRDRVRSQKHERGDLPNSVNPTVDPVPERGKN